MRVLAIRGANLASLAGEFEVRLDADPLASAGLFAITGPTGAGKSTLLDALCVALYDKTPRLCSRGGALIGREDEPEEARISANDVRALLTRGAGEGYAEVDLVGKSGQPLRATWHVRRARGRASGRLQQQTMAVRDLATGQVLSGPKSEILAAIEAQVGLSFAQFQRSVLLPQGDLAAFLRAPPQDRAALLERMTGTEIYGKVSAAAYRRAADEEKRLAALADAAERHAILDDGAREALEGKHKELVAARDAAKAALAAAEERARWHQRARELAAAERDAAGRLEKAQAAQKKSDALRGELVATEAASRLAPVASRADAAGAAQKAGRDAVSRGGGELSRAVSLKASAEKRRAEAEAAIAEEKQAAERLCRAARQAHAAAAFEAEAAAARAAENPVSEARAQRDALLSERESLRPVAEAVRACLLHDGAVAAARAERQRAEEQAAVLAAEARKLATERERALGALSEAERGLDEARRRESLAGHRSTLCDGEPCPLCGSREHPWADLGAALSEAARDAAKRVQALDAKRRALEDAIARARAQGDACGEARDKAAARAKAALADRSEAMASFAAAAAALGQLSGLEDPVDPRTRTWLEAKLATLTEAIEAAGQREAEAARLAQAAEHAHGTAAARRIEWEAAEARARQAGERRAGAEIEALERATLQEASARAVLSEARRRLEQAAEVAAAEAKNLARAVAAENTSERALRERLARGPSWIAQARAELAAADTAFSEARAVAGERARQRQAHLAAAPDRCRDDDACAHACEAAAKEAAARAESLARALSATEAALRTDDNARARRAEMNAEIAAAREHLAAYQMLSELIGSADGRKLRVFAQSLTLDALILYANDHLAELCDRYRLARVPGRDLDLQIIDRDLGDEVRSLNSLSGGETFLTALALALALSSLSATDIDIGSLLIDEGFGSLDTDALDVALSVLEALYASGRQVGLISHVPGIAERIGAQVRVIPRGGGKSTVRVVAS